MALGAFNPLALGSATADYKDAAAASKLYKQEIADLEVKQATASDTADMLSTSMGMTRDEVLQLADAAGIDLSQGYDAVYGRMLLFRDAQDATTGSTQSASSTMQVFADDMDSVKQAADDAKSATDMFKLSLDILTGAQVSLNEVESAYYAALDDAKGALDGLTGSVRGSERRQPGPVHRGRPQDQRHPVEPEGHVEPVHLDAHPAGCDYRRGAGQGRRAAAELLGHRVPDDRQQAGRRQPDGLDLRHPVRAHDEDQRRRAGRAERDQQHADADRQSARQDIYVRVKADGTVAAILGDPSAHSGRIGPAGNADGGYTGPGGKYQPAGIVHAGEVVFSQDDVAAHGGVGMVEMLRKSRPRGYADGGPVIQINTDDSQVAASVAAARSAVTKMMSVGPVGGTGVQRWSGFVLQALSMMGQPASLLNTVLRRMNQESGGNPRAINLTDINAKRGTPSKGLMQTIDPTFRAYHFPGTSNDVYDPLANILASMRYAPVPVRVAVGGLQPQGRLRDRHGLRPRDG
jgi:hypothetical protein